MSEISAFFVYGTLKRSHLRGGLWPRSPLQVHKAIIQANLFDLGPYPAATEGDHWVLGELWIMRQQDMPSTIQALDQIEGYDEFKQENEYVRRRVEAFFEAPKTIVSDNGADSGRTVEHSVPAYSYFNANAKRLANARLIEPVGSFLDRRVACWPDASARVPRSFSEE
jgi:gamma-glutamylcyclotransferase (GGCT)/AIG2-like uncharacterized protein YtfP